MSNLDTLKKIIPPDQAVANKAITRGLQQVKRIFNTDLTELAPVLETLETVDDLGLINSLSKPVPDSVVAVLDTALATGTGPGNSVTTNDVIGIAAGNTVSTSLPVVAQGLIELTELGALEPLTANGGSSGSATNGIYTLMGYALAGDYSVGGNIANSTTIPNTSYYSGPQTFGSVDLAFSTATTGLIAVANTYISGLSASYPDVISSVNQNYEAVAGQLATNVTNCIKADIDIANLAFDIANANLVSNATSSVLNFTSSLHDLGLDVAPGGTADFLAKVANVDDLSGQAVVASMREGRNIQRLNNVGILLDTQIPSVAPVGNVV